MRLLSNNNQTCTFFQILTLYHNNNVKSTFDQLGGNRSKYLVKNLEEKVFPGLNDPKVLRVFHAASLSSFLSNLFLVSRVKEIILQREFIQKHSPLVFISIAMVPSTVLGVLMGYRNYCGLVVWRETIGPEVIEISYKFNC